MYLTKDPRNAHFTQSFHFHVIRRCRRESGNGCQGQIIAQQGAILAFFCPSKKAFMCCVYTKPVKLLYRNEN